MSFRTKPFLKQLITKNKNTPQTCILHRKNNVNLISDTAYSISAHINYFMYNSVSDVFIELKEKDLVCQIVILKYNYKIIDHKYLLMVDEFMYVGGGGNFIINDINLDTDVKCIIEGIYMIGDFSNKGREIYKKCIGSQELNNYQKEHIIDGSENNEKEILDEFLSPNHKITDEDQIKNSSIQDSDESKNARLEPENENKQTTQEILNADEELENVNIFFSKNTKCIDSDLLLQENITPSKKNVPNLILKNVESMFANDNHLDHSLNLLLPDKAHEKKPFNQNEKIAPDDTLHIDIDKYNKTYHKPLLATVSDASIIKKCHPSNNEITNQTNSDISENFYHKTTTDTLELSNRKQMMEETVLNTNHINLSLNKIEHINSRNNKDNKMFKSNFVKVAIVNKDSDREILQNTKHNILTDNKKLKANEDNNVSQSSKLGSNIDKLYNNECASNIKVDVHRNGINQDKCIDNCTNTSVSHKISKDTSNKRLNCENTCNSHESESFSFDKTSEFTSNDFTSNDIMSDNKDVSIQKVSCTKGNNPNNLIEENQKLDLIFSIIDTSSNDFQNEQSVGFNRENINTYNGRNDLSELYDSSNYKQAVKTKKTIQHDYILKSFSEMTQNKSAFESFYSDSNIQNDSLMLQTVENAMVAADYCLINGTNTKCSYKRANSDYLLKKTVVYELVERKKLKWLKCINIVSRPSQSFSDKKSTHYNHYKM